MITKNAQSNIYSNNNNYYCNNNTNSTILITIITFIIAIYLQVISLSNNSNVIIILLFSLPLKASRPPELPQVQGLYRDIHAEREVHQSVQL